MDGGYSAVDNLEVMEEARNYNRFLIDEVLRHADPSGPIADFGAGTGTFARHLRDRGLTVTCIEPDRSLGALLEDDGFRWHPSLDDLAPASMGTVYSLNVLEHILDDTASLRDMHRVLAPGGRLYLYVPAFNVLYSSMDAKVGHHRRYRLEELVGKLTAAGFAVDRARYVDSLGFPATLLYKAVGNRKGDIDTRSVTLYDRIAFPLSRLLDRAVDRWVGKNLAVFARRI